MVPSIPFKPPTSENFYIIFNQHEMKHPFLYFFINIHESPLYIVMECNTSKV